ncbi:MAG: hypothetical protein JXM79_04860 [Sedimentisphaerales bacterium]|nr:hypothetical protein [Sedimentisphaerales bacterium]
MIKLSSIGSFFEEHVEKIVLVIVGLICIWLLIAHVLLSPNMVTYNESKFSPSAIDNEILEEAKALAQTLREPPEKLEPYQPRAKEFLAKLDSSITNVDIQSVTVAPVVASSESAVGVYDLPRIGDVEDVAIEHIRAVAYVPIGEVTEQNTYDKSGNEPNDIDLISVEGKFDVAGLYKRFKECFVEYVEQRWADPCLAEPLFAAVQLQRQELNGNGAWSPWQDVPRARIDQYRKLFNITEKVEQLPAGGLKVRLLQYDYPMVQIGLLQPDPYQFATADEEWLPPELHKEYKQIKAKEAMETKRQEMEEQREERNRQRDTGGIGNVGGVGRTGVGRPAPGSGRTRGNQRAGGSDLYGMGGGMDYGDTRSRGRSRTSRRSSTSSRTGVPGNMADPRGRSSGRDSRGRTSDLYGDMMYGDMMEPGMGGVNARYSPLNEVYTKYDEMVLTRLTEFEKLEKLTFWAHDDTVEPRKTYRYRLRLGVFNPVAGTNKMNAKYKDQKSDVILWSDFSDVTEPVEIMGKLYFFANNVREADKAVNVEVARLALGRWHSDEFWVRQGEVIGEPREPEPEKEDRNSRQNRMNDPTGRFDPMMGARTQQKTNVPEIIDYRTGAVMVDTIVVNDWLDKPLRTRNYFDLLYSYDGVNIEHMPVGPSFRPKTLASVHSHINRLQREPQEEFKSFGTSDRKRRGGLGGDMMDDYGGDYMMEDMYMMDQMGGMGRR